jgi:tRNA(fMet)-specific endonuclease VapC
MQMSGRYLLDTNIVVAMFGEVQAVEAHVSQADAVYVPVAVLAELYFGAYKSGRVQKNVQRVDKLVATSNVLDCDVETARQFGIIKNQLRARGRPIPDNDIWIAATALQHDLTLATRDSHFNEVTGLNYEAW